MPRPVPNLNGRALFIIAAEEVNRDLTWIIAHEWVMGSPPDPKAATAETLQSVGGVILKVSQAPLEFVSSSEGMSDSVPTASDWFDRWA